MIVSQTHQDASSTVSSPIITFQRAAKWLRTAALLLTLPASAIAASAQFAGPALPLTTDVNPPLTVTTDPAILYPANHDIQLDTGDAISIHLYGSGDYTPLVRIGLDGNIQLPLLGLVQVKGLTVPQAEHLIATSLAAAGMYRDPQISIQITESPNQLATVIGEVHGVVPVGNSKRLFDVIAAAGGFPQTASHTITINRPGVPQPIVLNLGTDPSRSVDSNVPIFPHDTIVVPRIGVVYLLGAFKNQASIPLQQTAPLTLMEVTSMGGGTTFGGKLSDVRIIRISGQTRSVVKVDIGKVLSGKAPDPVLQADDIVFLPSSFLKEAIQLGGIGTLLGVASILLYTFHN